MLWLYIILIPLMHVRRVPLFERKLQYSEAAFIPFVILWCTRWLRAGERRLHFPLLYPILFLTAAFALSLLNSESAGASALEFGGFFYLAALYFMALNILKGPGSLDRALRIWVFVGAIVSLLGLAAFGLHLAGWSPEVARNPFLFYSPMEAEAQGFPRITSTFRNPNMLVTYLQVTLSFGLALFFGKATGEGGRGWLAFGLCLIVAAAILTGSRREVGLFLTLFLILCLYGSGWLGALVRYLSFVALVGLAALSVLTTFWVIFPLEVRWGQGGRSLEVKADFSYSLHRLQHETAIRMIRDHPLIGVGYGTFTKNFPRYID
ncbi:MAG: O-antigen ligase family protein, partial [Nitrospinota bacterium]